MSTQKSGFKMGQIESSEAAAEAQTTTTTDTSKPASLKSAIEGCFSIFHFSRTSRVCVNVWLKRNLSLCRVFFIILLLLLQKLQNMEVNTLRFALLRYFAFQLGNRVNE